MMPKTPSVRRAKPKPKPGISSGIVRLASAGVREKSFDNKTLQFSFYLSYLKEALATGRLTAQQAVDDIDVELNKYRLKVGTASRALSSSGQLH